jgi:hypothetical protein
MVSVAPTVVHRKEIEEVGKLLAAAQVMDVLKKLIPKNQSFVLASVVPDLEVPWMEELQEL